MVSLLMLGALLYACPASAELKIPNPLIQPQKVKSVSEPSAAAAPPPPPASSLSSSSGLPIPLDGLSGAGASGKHSKTDALREVRDYLGSFHVSAILGKQAILRRVPGMQGLQGLGQPAASLPTASTASSTPIPLAGVQGGRSESVLVSDGEPLNFLGEGVTLLPKVTATRVFLYYLEGGRKASPDAREAVVFFGEVESPPAATRTAPVLERPDSTYRQSISVETRARTSPGGSFGSTGPNGAGAQASLPLQ